MLKRSSIVLTMVLVTNVAPACMSRSTSQQRPTNPDSAVRGSAPATTTPQSDELKQSAPLKQSAELKQDSTELKQDSTELKQDSDELKQDSDEQATEPAEIKRAFTRETSPLFETPFQSLKLAKTIWVQAEPFADADYLGMIGGSARPEYLSHVKNDECPFPWIEIKPRGFICVKVKPSTKPPTQASAKPPRPMIGTYGIARKGAVFYRSIEAAEVGSPSRPNQGDMVRLTRTIELDDGRVLWRTQRGEYVDSAFVGRLGGSRFGGIALLDDNAADTSEANRPDKTNSRKRLPLGFAVNTTSRRGRGSVIVRDQPLDSGRRVRMLKSKTIVSVGELSNDGTYIKIGEHEWVARKDLRVAALAPIPAEVGPNEYWVDVDLDEQVVVIYHGKRPIFATLGSSGREKDPTPTGVFRVTRKKKQTTMASDRGKRQTYSVAVPWPTYFHEGFAFHSAYWHNSFGVARSHGCINLSPKDALFLHSLLEPKLPPGWLSVFSHESQPGSIIQLRAKVPVPIPPSAVDEKEEKKTGKKENVNRQTDG